MNYDIHDLVLHHLCIYYFIIRRINIRLLFSSHNHSPYFFKKSTPLKTTTYLNLHKRISKSPHKLLVTTYLPYVLLTESIPIRLSQLTLSGIILCLRMLS